MSVLVDTSVWIEYLRGTRCVEEVDYLIDEDLIATNTLILAELLPPLLARGQDELASLIRQVRLVPLQVDWEDLIALQVACLKKNINKVSIADLIIAQNAIHNGLRLFSADKHFQLLSQVCALALFEW